MKISSDSKVGGKEEEEEGKERAWKVYKHDSPYDSGNSERFHGVHR